MREQILKIIEDNPKNYKNIIKSNHNLMSWVDTNTLIASDHLPSRIYSAVHQELNICSLGNQKKFTRFSTGFSFCGPASTCTCTRTSIAENVSLSKKSYSAEKKEKINNKRCAAMISKYGVAYNSQRLEIKHIWTRPKIPLEIYNKLIDKNWLENEYILKDRTAVDIAQELGVYYSTVLDYCRQHEFKIKQRSNYSLEELEIAEFIKSLNIDIERNARGIIGNRELDIYIPSKNLAIEVNGLYWHSYKKLETDDEPKTRHLDKTILANSFGIDLLHITDWEWHNKKEIVKSIIRSKLGIIDKKIPARKTVVKEVSSSDARKFLDQNHIQGHRNSAIKIGLYYNKELVMLVTAGKSKFRKPHMEIYRLASKNNVTVVGGASKLVKKLKEKINNDILFSYCDRDKSNGNVYKKLGFELVNETEPGYFWTDGNEMYSRYKCEKQKLKKFLKSFDPSKGEDDNMFAAGYRKYCNSGNFVFMI
jgi:hypothetical protein